MERRVIPFGGGGLVSSLEDMSSFARMLAHKCVYDGERVLSEALFEEFRKDQTRPFGTGLAGVGFGLGIGIRLAQNAEVTPEDVGELFWSGIFFTTIRADPETGLSGVFMSQMRPDQRSDTARRLKQTVNSKISR